ncbi:hypothetical protein J2Y40_003864 [Chryseobacterium sp. 2987]|nr:hypothetical protein [Chryseobacterium sp. 2987]
MQITFTIKAIKNLIAFLIFEQNLILHKISVLLKRKYPTDDNPHLKKLKNPDEGSTSKKNRKNT